MTTEQLIARLARQAGPVQVMAPLATRWRQWSLVAAGTLIAAWLSVGLRADAASRVFSGDFLIRATITALVAAVAARHALRWTVPGEEPDAAGRWWPGVLVVLWAAALVVPLAGPAFGSTLAAVRWHSSCAWQIGAVSLLPAAWMFQQARRAAPYEVGWASGQAALAAAAAGALAVQWTCSIDDRAHHLAWHLAPVVALTLLAAGAGRLLLRRS